MASQEFSPFPTASEITDELNVTANLGGARAVEAYIDAAEEASKIAEDLQGVAEEFRRQAQTSTQFMPSAESRPFTQSPDQRVQLANGFIDNFITDRLRQALKVGSARKVMKLRTQNQES